MVTGNSDIVETGQGVCDDEDDHGADDGDATMHED